MPERPGFNPEKENNANNADDFIEVTGHDGQKIRINKSAVKKLPDGPRSESSHTIPMKSINTEPLPIEQGRKRRK